MSNLPLNIDLQQVLLHALNFVILFGGLYFILYSPVKKFMDARTAQYKEASEKAKNDMAEAEAAKEEYTKKLAEAEKTAEDMRSQAEKELSELKEARRKEAEAEAESIVSAARKRAEAEKAEILSSAKKDITEIAAEAAEKVVYKDASEAYEGFLDVIDDND